MRLAEEERIRAEIEAKRIADEKWVEEQRLLRLEARQVCALRVTFYFTDLSHERSVSTYEA